MKGNKKILVVAILLLMISVCYTTYAIYRSTATATGTINAAAWSVKVAKGSGTLTDIESANLSFGVNDITWTTHTGKNDTIAPGDTGTITFNVDASGSEVDVILEASVTAAANSLPAGMTATVTSGTNGKQTINYASGAGNMTATVTITVTWTGTISDETSKDTTDKSFNGHELSIPVSLTARQKLASDS